MNREQCRDFLELAFKRLLSSAWTLDDAARDLERQFEAEQTIWKRQEQEATSVFSGKFYL